MTKKVQIFMHHRPDRSFSIEERHERVTKKMAEVGPPLGFRGLALPPAPDCGRDLSAWVQVKSGVPGLECFLTYCYRGEKYIWRDRAIFDERLWYQFGSRNRRIDYRDVLRVDLPEVLTAFEPYLVAVYLSDHSVCYESCLEDSNPDYARLSSDRSINTDARSFIDVLNPAQFWDAELCRRALSFDRDEVIRRTRDVAIVAEPVLDGVYLVLNDDPNLTYEDFVEMNERVRPLLGLDQRWAAM